jgi:hypothetical protein
MGVKRVEQLLALATDPAASEEEARTAALQAARTIRRDGLVVTTPGQVYSRSAYYDAPSVTPQGRQLGPGTPALPPRRQAPTRARELPSGESTARFLEVNLDFKDDAPEVKQDPAFSAALLALLRKGT